MATKQERQTAGQRIDRYLSVISGANQTERNLSTSGFDPSKLPALNLFHGDDIELFEPFCAEGVPLIDVNRQPSHQKPVDIATIVAVNCDEADQAATPHRLESKKFSGKDAEFSVMHCKSIPLKRLRGRKLLSTHAVEFTVAAFGAGEYFYAQRELSFSKERQWCDTGRSLSDVNYLDLLDRRHPTRRAGYRIEEHREKHFDAEIDGWVKGLHGLEDWHRKIWGVEIGSRDGLRLFVPCDAPGVKSLLAERDKPAGANRRKAVIHWVNEHWRRNVRDENLEHEVVGHLRGMDKWFTWLGYDCRIRVPERLIALAANNKATKRSKSRRKTMVVTKQERKVETTVSLQECFINGELAGYRVDSGDRTFDVDTLEQAMDRVRQLLLGKAAHRVQSGKSVTQDVMQDLARIGAASVLADIEPQNGRAQNSSRLTTA